MPSLIEMYNQAIALLPANQISSEGENSLEARECRRFYPLIKARMLEGPVEWSFQIARAPLALLVVNGRSSEWAYAYALPADFATPIYLTVDLGSAGTALPYVVEEPYIIDRGVLYTNAEYAVLEYGVNDVAEADLPAMVAEAMILELASKLAVPVKSDRRLKLELAAEADAAWQRAMADDQNRQPRTMPSHQSEALAARAGY